MSERVSDEWLAETVNAWSEATRLLHFYTCDKAPVMACLRELQQRRVADNEGSRVGSVYDHLANRFGHNGNQQGRGG